MHAWLILVLLVAGSLQAQEKNWEKEWNAALAAARKEGKVVVTGSPDAVMRQEIIPKFTSRYGIPVEYIAGRSSQIVSRVQTERSAGIYTFDLFMGGVSTAALVSYPEKLLDPLKPLMILPEVVDPKKWKTGKLMFIDPEEQYVLRVFRRVDALFLINKDHAQPQEIRSAKDLLLPKWKGKIATDDPTTTGSGINAATHFYRHFGAEFIQKLYHDQKPAVSADRRQLADWLARGINPICLTCGEDDVRDLKKEGFNIQGVFELSDIKGEMLASPWALTLANKAPHPNAAKIFANWIVSKEALEIYSRGYGAPTLRNDVDESFLQPEVIPRPGVQYFDDSEWNWTITGKNAARDQVRKILKGR